MTLRARDDRPTPGPADGRGRRALVHGTDLIVALIILAAAGGLYYVTTGFEEVAQMLQQNIPPSFFPRLVLWTIVVLTVLLPFEHLLSDGRRADLDAERKSRIKPMALLTAGLMAGVVFSIPWAGTYLAMVLACVLMPMLWGETRLKVLVPFAALFPAAVTVVFNHLLKVHFEPGFLLGPVLN